MALNTIKRIWFGDKFDGVVEAVRYTQKGEIDWVRVYERRGPTWSDHFLLERGELLARLKNGKRFYTGKRINYMASEFELDQKVRVEKQNGNEIIISEKTIQKSIDHLDGVPEL